MRLNRKAPAFAYVFLVIAAPGTFEIRASIGPNGPETRQLPFAFAPNRGQAARDVRYTGTGPEFKAWFEDRRVVLQQGQTVIAVNFRGGAVSVILPEGAIKARANYFRGHDPRRWQTDLPLYSAIRYSGIWHGIELIYKADRGRAKAEYQVSPGTPVESIELGFDGDATVQADGSLRIHGADGDFIEEKPALFQKIGARRIEVAGGFRRTGASIGFWAGEYDHSQPLIIDPSILFSSYFGGTSQDAITAVAVDASFNTVVAGWTSSADLPANGARKKSGGGVDAFVAAFAPAGGSLIYCSYLGGTGDDRAFGLALDSARNVYITGWTSSVNFPVLGALQSKLSGTRDAFVAKLNSTGSVLLYSTYLGGSGVDVGNAIAVDSTGSAVIAGDSTSTNLPVTPKTFQLKPGGAQDAFVAKLSPAGSVLTFLTYLGGAGIEHASSVKLASTGIYLGGYTWSSNFPVAAPFQPKSGGSQDGFVAKMALDGTRMIFSTYLGGYGGSVGAPEAVNSVAVDPLGNVVAAGTTSSTNFPVTPGAVQTVFGGQTDGFITRYSAQGQMLQSTFMGGSLSDGINGLALDFHGLPYVTGFTASLDFPVQRPLQNVNAGGLDAFAVKLTTDLSTIIFGTYLGGSGGDTGNAIAVDARTSIVVGGQTGSGDFPIKGGPQTSLPSVLSAFVTKISPPFMIAVARPYLTSSVVFAMDPWHIAGSLQYSYFGGYTDTPIVGDWDGTGRKRIGVFSNGKWLLDINGNGVFDASDKTVLFGQAGDIPVVGDWNGTGRIALGLFRQGTFILDLSGHLSGVPTGRTDAVFVFGQGGDIPITGDWSGSGTTNVGVFRNGLWLVDYNGNRTFSGYRSYYYGQAGDIPVVGDWDGSGRAKIGVYRAGNWILDYDGDYALTVLGLNELSLWLGNTVYQPAPF